MQPTLRHENENQLANATFGDQEGPNICPEQSASTPKVLHQFYVLGIKAWLPHWPLILTHSHLAHFSCPTKGYAHQATGDNQQCTMLRNKHKECFYETPSPRRVQTSKGKAYLGPTYCRGKTITVVPSHAKEPLQNPSLGLAGK